MNRPGELLRDNAAEVTGEAVLQETLKLESTTGLSVDLRVMRPAYTPEGGLPVLVVIGGHRTGKDAVDLVGRPEGVAFAAIDYPYAGSHRLDGVWQTVTAVPEIQRAFLDTPPALLLARQWLERQPWVDADRVELVGVSLGVPFAAVAGALDGGFRRVWLIHGGADNLSWTMHAGRDAIDNETLRRFAARSLLLLVYADSFCTTDWIREIAPRPLIVIAARDDDFVPAEARAPFVEAAAEDASVELIWTTGLHIGGGRDDVLQQLLAIVLKRVETGPVPLASRLNAAVNARESESPGVKWD